MSKTNQMLEVPPNGKKKSYPTLDFCWKKGPQVTQTQAFGTTQVAKHAFHSRVIPPIRFLPIQGAEEMNAEPIQRLLHRDAKEEDTRSAEPVIELRHLDPK